MYAPQSTNVERRLETGDEELDWRTYSDLWRDLQLTRGALDVLVFNGKVPWVSGEKLSEFFAASHHPALEAAQRLGANLTIDRKTTYYAVDAFLLELQAGESIARLTGKEEHDAAKVYKATIPLLKNVRLFGGDELEEEKPPPNPWAKRKR